MPSAELVRSRTLNAVYHHYYTIFPINKAIINRRRICISAAATDYGIVAEERQNNLLLVVAPGG